MVAMDATATNNGTQANYQYNIDGIRTSKTVNGQATHYLIDNTQAYAQVIAETDSLGSRLKTYLYGDDLISQTDSDNTTNTFHYDGLGSTRLLSSDAGEQSDSYDYLAFGELQNQTGTTENNYLYTGEQFDGDLDQYYLRARYYDQNVGRFTQQDEWMGRDGEPVTLNKYLYTHADPVNGIDPSGYMSLVSLNTAQAGQGVLINIAHQHVFRKAFKKMGCEVGFALAEETIRHGIYVLYDSVSGRY
ncbi:tRNA nuclease WapA precursor [Pseudoalteromonas sp. P1-9]|uniref:RHS repeat-associated core domain-containing protein n=1 Tax=Pseudoalteromonas sp. P1-9 TaxID=1710354 RepID=UPI0006D62DA3|nr:RHS repeat-associated core domain-containing protein [Pseudoalteromonas sp. P1-9]KPV93602.1 tRNA nuclease WapA precursor [Pseudoalteromonas sp. P1-9]